MEVKVAHSCSTPVLKVWLPPRNVSMLRVSVADVLLVCVSPSLNWPTLTERTRVKLSKWPGGPDMRLGSVGPEVACRQKSPYRASTSVRSFSGHVRRALAIRAGRSKKASASGRTSGPALVLVDFELSYSM